MVATKKAKAAKASSSKPEEPARNKKGCCKTVSETYLKQAVSKTMREQFSDMSDFEKICKIVNNQTMRARLMSDRREWLLGTEAGAKISLGPGYYSSIRALYLEETTIEDKLQWNRNDPENEQPINESLNKAMEQFFAHRVNRSPLLQYLGRAQKCTNKEPSNDNECTIRN